MIQAIQITQIIQLIEARVGLSANTLERIGIADLVQQVIVGDVESYLRQLRTGDENSPEWQHLIHALTIGETYFLRDKQHFRILRENIVPRILLKRRQDNDLRLTICCVGCATGEEPYSIATLLYETVPDITNWDITIIASDVNKRAIEAAKIGIYREWSFRQTLPIFRQRYFTQVDDEWQIAPRIQAMVTFQRANILDGLAVSQADIIFCRHVLMYFSPEHLAQAEAILHKTLSYGGWLLLGQAEALRSKRDDWLLHMFPGTPIYQKADPSVRHQTEPISYPSRPNRPKPQTHDNSPHYAEAVKAIHDDNANRAEYHLSELLSEYPDHAQAHILIASMLANRQAYPEAMAHLELALEADGLLADAHYVKGLIQLEQDEESGAIQSFSAAIYCQRDHALASFLLGNLYAQQKDLEKARRNWRNTLRGVKDNEPDAYVSDLSDMTVARLHSLLDKDLSDEDEMT
jgi:chemotaxis protein methyltransferase CheR